MPWQQGLTWPVWVGEAGWDIQHFFFHFRKKKKKQRTNTQKKRIKRFIWVNGP